MGAANVEPAPLMAPEPPLLGAAPPEVGVLLLLLEEPHAATASVRQAAAMTATIDRDFTGSPSLRNSGRAPPAPSARRRTYRPPAEPVFPPVARELSRFRERQASNR